MSVAESSGKPEEVARTYSHRVIEFEKNAERVGLVGRSTPHREVLSQLYRAAQTNAEILLVGETGVGKELYARFVHESSSRAKRPFCPVNCSIQETLFESEMFGHCAGAYTGAVRGSDGFVAAAEGGTLFLDEVDQLPMAGQVKLLRFLQEREYRRLGETRLRSADVRIVCATNRCPENAIQEGCFREDLYYRLNVLEVPIPPLRDRREDIGELLHCFTKMYAAECDRSTPIEFTSPARQRLLHYSWPGNVRQLENFVRRIVALQSDSSDSLVGLDALEFIGEREGDVAAETPSDDDLLELSFGEAKRRVVTDFERRYLTNMLRTTKGNVNRAAKRAGKDRRAFFELMRKHGIDRQCFVQTPSSAPPGGGQEE